jgi:hypothetical protein
MGGLDLGTAIGQENIRVDCGKGRDENPETKVVAHRELLCIFGRSLA